MKNYIHRLGTVVLILIIIFLLSGCKSEQNGATKAVEAYIQALSNKDSIKISSLSCADWEQNAILEVDSLTGVGSKVANLKCDQTGQTGSDTYVSCTGTLDLDYNGEGQQIDLSTRTYIARQEDGEWRVCGYR